MKSSWRHAGFGRPACGSYPQPKGWRRSLPRPSSSSNRGPELYPSGAIIMRRLNRDKESGLRRAPPRRISAADMLKALLILLTVFLALPSAPVRAVEGGAAPFDGDLARLSEILGALHYLRGLCGAKEGQKWR